MSSLTAVRDGIYNRLMSSSVLQTIMGAVRVHYVFPDEEEPPLPYIVHRVDLNENPDSIVEQGIWFCDIWDYSGAATRAEQIRDEITRLFDLWQLDGLTDARGVRFNSNGSGFVPDTETGIWHIAMQFRVRFARVADATALLTR